MMRAAYFASKLGFKIQDNCRKSIKKQGSRIDIVSKERIRDEFIKILRTDKPSIGLVILQKTGLMKIIFPEIHVMYGMDQTKEWHHKDIFAHTMQVVDNSAKLSEKMELRFAALVHDIAKPITRRIDKKKGYTEKIRYIFHRCNLKEISFIRFLDLFKALLRKRFTF